ncbi:MAG: hypothetical protein AAF764_10855 [Pseudomonadota bacterium]
MGIPASCSTDLLAHHGTFKNLRSEKITSYFHKSLRIEMAAVETPIPAGAFSANFRRLST